MKKVLLFTLTALLLSCGEEKKEVVIPANILSKEKMQAVLVDIHIAEAKSNLQVSDSLTAKPGFQGIFEKNKVSQKQYEESLSFYMDHPEILDEIYKDVLNELSRMQGEAGK